MRYVNIDKEAYTDALGTSVDGSNKDILTAIAGVKVSKDYDVDDIVITPEVSAAGTYDVVRDDETSVVTLANGGSYVVNGAEFEKFGYEVGAGITASLNKAVKLSLGYDGKLRSDYKDHTGLVNFKYHF